MLNQQYAKLQKSAFEFYFQSNLLVLMEKRRTDAQTDEEQDSFSLGLSRTDSRTNENQLIFRISSSFLEQDFESEKLSKNDQSDFQINYHSQQIEKDDAVPEVDPKFFTDQQIWKVNSTNQTIRISIALNIELKQLFAKTYITGLKRDEDSTFMPYLNSKIETIQWNRVEQIPLQKREYYMGKSDRNQIQKRKHIESLIRQKLKQFQIKKGLTTTQFQKQQLAQMLKTFAEFVRQNNLQVDSQQLRDVVKQVVFQSESVLKSRIAITLQQSYESLLNIEEKVSFFVSHQSDFLEAIRSLKIKEDIEQTNQIIQMSDHLIEFVSPKRIFGLVPNLQKEEAYDFDSFPSSYSKMDN